MKNNETGIYQLANGNWEYRFSIVKNGKKSYYRKRKDAQGNALRTKTQARKARAAAIEQVQLEDAAIKKEEIPKITVKALYEEYCLKGRSGKAYTTIKKQDSLWKNHISKKFGSRYVDEISIAEINDYLAHLYYNEERAYGYVESFLKMFYLIFGQAYSRDYLLFDRYNKLCLNKGTKIHMPKMKVDEEDDVVSFSQEELNLLDKFFENSNAKTAYFLGRYCGLRINECYGLKWSNVDLENGVIVIDRQMQYQDGLIKLVSVKTRNAKRTLYMSDCLRAYLQILKEKRDESEKTLFAVRQQNQKFITDIDGKMISSLELVNTLDNGKIQTVNSMKYHSCKIKETLQINFKYHYLRHTYGTVMAELNTPSHLLRNQMGHSSINVTQKYYIAMSKRGIDILMDNLNKL